ncbi:SRPBCC domain-containing protein [Sebaldella sp. S0638]|uniref:SRPBCC domain-containing protein n=1 Tax=Sebaldella sp. S0638 TaxID=2957809 RepID=UPI00209DD82E|nr:SRPBCC domain-containing protein [Sebaldella sp. S0638]MCP1223554.1 SRPBCC domain-containing protein [Sebaldella sp. S0638]
MEIILKSKMKILKPVSEVFDAFVNPEKIGNFWFTASSCKWETGKTVTLTYDEYTAEFDIFIVKVLPEKKIVFEWGSDEEKRTNTILFEILDNSSTIVTTLEEGWQENENLTDELLKNKEGWVYMLTCLKAYLENGVNTLRTGLII